MRLAVLAALLSAAPALVRAQEPTVHFTDEATQDTSLIAWRDRLVATVDRRDSRALIAALSPSILNSFGGDGGIAEFRQTWDLGTRQDSSRVWPLLAKLLRSGGRFVNGEFVAPFWFVAEPQPPLPTDLDSYDARIVAGRNVRVRREPTTSAPVVATLSYVVVRRRTGSTVVDSSGRSWDPIELISSQQRGWVSSEWLETLTGYRLAIASTPSGWELRMLVVGD